MKNRHHPGTVLFFLMRWTDVVAVLTMNWSEWLTSDFDIYNNRIEPLGKSLLLEVEWTAWDNKIACICHYDACLSSVLLEDPVGQNAVMARYFIHFTICYCSWESCMINYSQPNRCLDRRWFNIDDVRWRWLYKMHAPEGFWIRNILLNSSTLFA